MKQRLLLLAVSTLLSACNSLSGGQADSGCRYRERDLTVGWYSRSYWCIPDGSTPQPVTRKSATP